MKNILFVAALFSFAFSDIHAQQINENYDAELAGRLAGNDNGMKKYVFVILKNGSNKLTDKAIADSLFTGHMANIHRLADEGMLLMAGPLWGGNDSYKGIFILNVDNFEDAKKMVETDPAVLAKALEPEFHMFFGSAALQEMTPIHKSIQKYK